MYRSSQVLVAAIVTMAAAAATSVHTDESQTPQQASAVQGWAGTAPSAEPPLEPRPRRSRKMRCGLPLRRGVHHAAGGMGTRTRRASDAAALLRLPRCGYHSREVAAIDFHVPRRS
jgi:hypothetical protein